MEGTKSAHRGSFAGRDFPQQYFLGGESKDILSINRTFLSINKITLPLPL